MSHEDWVERWIKGANTQTPEPGPKPKTPIQIPPLAPFLGRCSDVANGHISLLLPKCNCEFQTNVKFEFTSLTFLVKSFVWAASVELSSLLLLWGLFRCATQVCSWQFST